MAKALARLQHSAKLYRLHLLSVLRDLAGGDARIRGIFRARRLRQQLLETHSIEIESPTDWGLSAYLSTIEETSAIRVPGTAFAGPVDQIFIWPQAQRHEEASDFDDEQTLQLRDTANATADLASFPSDRLNQGIVYAGPGFGKSALLHLILIALFLGVGDFGFAAGIPSTLHKVEDNSGPPAWLSEETLRAAMDARNQPIGSRLESVGHLFDDWQSLSTELERYAETKDFTIAPDGTLGFCEPQEVSYYWNERAKGLKRLVELSTAITSIQIADSKPGFLFGHAGELLEVEVLSVLKDIGTTGVPQNGFFLFDPYARMLIDGKPLCKGGNQVPSGEFLLFQIQTELQGMFELPIFPLDSSALVSIDGAYYGTLLDHTVDPKELAKQISTLDQLLHLGLP